MSRTGVNARTVFSGIQPTGSPTLGNYLGAIRAWVELQDRHDCIYSIVDLHALTAAADPAALRGRCLDLGCLLLACGLDPGSCILFLQSQVPEHAELAWLLGCSTRMGELERMTQYKEKARAHAANLTVGLFTYPVLMAADILLYDAALVPVGEDQRQHVELAREIASRFNREHGAVFTLPEVLIGSSVARVHSLSNPARKMSKTDDDPKSYLALLDPPEAVRSKVRAAVTGSGRAYEGEEASAGIRNLVSLMAALRGTAPQSVAAAFAGRGYAEFKEELAETINGFLQPIQKRYGELRADEAAMTEVLEDGARKARRRARPVLSRAYEAAGLVLPRTAFPQQDRPPGR